MKLIEFSYKDVNWELLNLELNTASLIVGKNATGKTRALKQLSTFFKIIRQTGPYSSNGEFRARFEKNNGDIFTYHFINNGESSDNWSITEKLLINDRLVLERIPGKEVQLFNVIDNTFEIVNPPANKLVIHIHRDIKKYPFLEDIAVWAEQAYSFKFASIIADFNNVFYETSLTAIDDIAVLYLSLNISDKRAILTDLSDIGFFIENIEAYEDAMVSFQIKEKGIKHILGEHELSQGMLRSLYLLIFIRYLVVAHNTSTIIIDDLCEGLDYERATNLGKKVYEICQQNNIQLIATSNDMFLMEAVSIEHWNILQRNGGVVTAINAKGHPELFGSFKFTGLSNFDFFSSDFISQKIENND